MNGQTSLTGPFAVTFMASILILIMFFGLVVIWIIDGRTRKEQALHSFLAASAAWVITQIIKDLFPTLRPYQLDGTQPLTLTLLHSDGAFPSSHSAVAFALAITVWLHSKRLGWVFILMALGVAGGRVLANVHYVTDVLVGSIIGVFVAFAVDKIHVFNLLSKTVIKK